MTTITNKIETVKLRNGATVLAKQTKYGLNAVTYSNDTQANIKQILLQASGVNCHVIGFGTPVKFIRIY